MTIAHNLADFEFLLKLHELRKACESTRFEIDFDEEIKSLESGEGSYCYFPDRYEAFDDSDRANFLSNLSANIQNRMAEQSDQLEMIELITKDKLGIK
jgi:hypothetical protein